MTVDNITENGQNGIDRSRLEACLSVFEALESLPLRPPRRGRGAPGHRAALQDGQAAPAARSGGTRSLAADRAVTEATATGAPGRIDDETQGIPLASSVAGEIAGILRNARGLLHLQAALPSRSTRSTTSSARPAPRSTGPAATPAPT